MTRPQFRLLSLLALSTLILAGCSSATPPAASNKPGTPTSANSTTIAQTTSADPAAEKVSTTISPTSGYTLEDVAKHSNRDNCWMTINGSVYDVTNFIDQHPGGEQILSGCGIDATSLFQEEHGGGKAKRMLENFKIGSMI